ncbi:MAG: alpha/beta fold hydrolase [Acidobacteriota bacterium]
MKKIIIFVMVVLISVLMVSGKEILPSVFKGETFVVESSDGLKIKADVYEVEDKKAPVILLFHQAGFSRGEYRETAPLLNELGFNCVAVDQRSGKAVNGVKNEAYLDAVAKKMGTKYPDAFPDLKATLKFAMRRYPSNKIIVMGSSYSASLVFVLAQKYLDKISAVISFSPGEYFKFRGKEIKEYAQKVKCPVFITSAKKEHGYWKGIYESIPEGKKTYFLPEKEGIHGSRALWKSNPNHKEYRKALEKFLLKVKKRN